jgi:hypothetical protein
MIISVIKYFNNKTDSPCTENILKEEYGSSHESAVLRSILEPSYQERLASH